MTGDEDEIVGELASRSARRWTPACELVESLLDELTAPHPRRYQS